MSKQEEIEVHVTSIRAILTSIRMAVALDASSYQRVKLMRNLRVVMDIVGIRAIDDRSLLMAAQQFVG